MFKNKKEINLHQNNIVLVQTGNLVHENEKIYEALLKGRNMEEILDLLEKANVSDLETLEIQPQNSPCHKNKL